MDRLTRKELKQDRFAQEVSQTVAFLTAHKRQILRYGAIALAAVVVFAGLLTYNRYQRNQRQKQLAAAMDLLNAPVGPTVLYGPNAFPTAEEKNKAIEKALNDLASKYPNREEGLIARYLLGSRLAEAGRLDEASKHLAAAATGSSPYASLAKLALAEVFVAQGRTAEAEKLLRELINQPSVLVPKEQATLNLARLLASSRPDEARKLLEPLRGSPGPVGRAATEALEAIEAQRLATGT